MAGLLRAEYLTAVVGALCMVISWIGWGSLLQRTLRLGQPAGWALRAGWGMAVVLAIGGVAILFRFSGPILLMLCTATGALVWLLDLVQHFKQKSDRPRLAALRDPWWWLCLAPALAALAVLLLGSIETNRILVIDDAAAYMVFTKRMLQTGTLLEPYSFRRLSTYGGQQFLHAQQFLFAPYGWNLTILEWGLAPILIAGTVWEMIRPRSLLQRIAAGLMLLLLTLMTIPTFNSQSQATGVFMFITLLRTIWLPLNRRNDLRTAAVAGLVAAGVSTLRINFLPVAVVLMIASYAWLALCDRPHWALRLRQLAVAIAAFIVFLAGWAIVLYQSSGSLFFPLMKGNLRPEYQTFDRSVPLAEKLKVAASFFNYYKNYALIAALFFAFRSRTRKYLFTAPFVVMLLAVALVLSFTRADFLSLYRYIFPSIFAVVLAALALSLRREKSRLWIALSLAVMLAICLCNEPLGRLIYSGKATYLSAAKPLQFRMPAAIQPQTVLLYYHAQSAVPSGEPFLAACSAPQNFDYARNPIINLDLPGAAGPDPGIPIMQGGRAVKQYLLAHGIHYFVLVDPNSDVDIYSPKTWEGLHNDSGSYVDVLLTYARAYAKAAYELMASEEVVFKEGPICVLRLRDEQ